MHKREREPENTIYSKTCMDTIVKIYVNIIDYGWLMVLLPMCKCINLRAHMTKFTTLSKCSTYAAKSAKAHTKKGQVMCRGWKCCIFSNTTTTVISLSPWIWSLSEQWKHVHRIIFGFTVYLFFIFSFYYATLSFVQRAKMLSTGFRWANIHAKTTKWFMWW